MWYQELRIIKVENGFILEFPYQLEGEENIRITKKIAISNKDDSTEEKEYMVTFFERVIPMMQEILYINSYDEGRFKYSKLGYEIKKLKRKKLEDEFKEYDLE